MNTQREIKFRAWDGNRMVYTGDKVYPSHFNEELKAVTDPCEVFHNQVYVWVRETNLKHATNEYFDHPTCYGAKAFMQFTGLKDKNGVEVYEGDIIDFTKCDPLPDGSWLRTVVQWNETDCQFDYGPVSFWIGHVSSDGEIIGNVYEHPELLKA